MGDDGARGEGAATQGRGRGGGCTAGQSAQERQERRQLRADYRKLMKEAGAAPRRGRPRRAAAL